MKRIIGIILLLTLTNAVYAETPPEEEWSKTFGGTDSDEAWSVQQTSDGGYILAGATDSYGAGSKDFWLLKTNSDGDKQWDKTFGGTGWDLAGSVQQTSDGGYILAGWTGSYGAGSGDVWLVKTDSNGDKQWDKTFGGTARDMAYSIQQTSDGGYILAGWTGSYGAGSEDVWLLKTDSNGNKQWDKTFGGTGWDMAYSIQQTSDGGYILAGATESYGANSRDVWLLKTDSNGNKQWDKIFGGTDAEEAYSIQQTSDGGYILAIRMCLYGAGSEDVWLLKTDSNGNKQWDKIFGGTGGDRANSVQQTSDGGYILAGMTTSYGAGSEDFWLLKTDSKGNKQWDKTFGGTGWDRAYSVQQTSDGGYILAGFTESYGAGPRDVWLIKVESTLTATPTSARTPTITTTRHATPVSTPATTQRTATDWPMFRHDTERTGFTNDSIALPLKLLWKYKTNDWVTTSSPAVVNNTVYIGSTDRNVYALDAIKGTLKWRYETQPAGKYDGVWSSPTVVNSTVYVGARDHYIYALDANTGTLKWKYQTGGMVESSPTLANGVLYVTSSGSVDGIYALNAESGKLKWKFQASSTSSPTVKDGLLYVGSWDHNIYALDADTGDLKWKFKTDDTVESSPAVADGIVYIGSRDSHTYALDAYNGQLVWKFQAAGYIWTSPAIANGILYIASTSELYALNVENGKLIWKNNLGGGYSSPAIANGILYKASGSGIYAVDAKNGEIKWNYSTIDHMDGSSPAIANGVVYVGSRDGYVYAFSSSGLSSTAATTRTSQQNKSNKTTLIFGGAAILIVLVLLVGESRRKGQKAPKPTSPTPKPVSSTQSISSFDSHLNEAKSVVRNAEVALRGAMRGGVKISQSTQLLLHDAQKALETVDFAGAKAYAHKCIENVEVAVKEHEEKQAQKAQEQQEMEQLRKEALNQIKVAKDSLEKAEKLDLPVQEAKDMLYKAQYAFESKYYKNAKNEAQQCVEFVNAAVKNYEEEQARKEREKQELEQLRNEAAEEIKIARHLLEKSKNLGNPTPLDAEHLLKTAQRSFDEGKYAAAKEGAQYLNNVIERLIEESEPNITLKLPSRMQHNVWKCRDITITNNGTAHAKNIVISFSKALEARELKTIPQLKVGEEKTLRPRTRPTEEGDVPIDYIIQFTDLQEGTYKTEHTIIIPISREPELPASKPAPSDQFTTFRTVWDPIDKDFVWGTEKPDEYGELSRIKRWIEGNNPHIYWFLLKIVNHADYPVTEWNVTLYTEQALTITEAHLNEKPVRIMDERFDTNEYKKICVASVSPELGMSIPAKSERMMYFKMDVGCEGALKKEFDVFGVVRLGKSPQIEVPIREKRFTYKCKQGDFRNMFYGSTNALASQVMGSLQNSYNREIVQNFTNSFRLIREFEKYCNERYVESKILVGKLEVIYSSLKAAEPITKDEILPLVEQNLDELRKLGKTVAPNVEIQKERGMRMCEKLIELLHIATSKIK
jgi:outer membrane protein assembly factor BamB